MTKQSTARQRHNKNKFTPAFAIGYKPNSESPFLFRFFYKDIFRMPTFNDLYYTYNININPKLLPEYSEQYDAGFTYTKNFKSSVSQFSFSVDGYYNNIRDKIIAVPAQNLFIWTMKNIGKVRITGIDVNAQINGKFSSDLKWSARIAYTWQQALDVTDPSSSVYKNEIPYTPRSVRFRAWPLFIIRSGVPDIVFYFPVKGIRWEKTIQPICCQAGMSRMFLYPAQVPLQIFSNNDKRRSEQYIQSAI